MSFYAIHTQNRYAQNEEHVAEQKAKEEKWERQATMYLDKGVKGVCERDGAFYDMCARAR